MISDEMKCLESMQATLVELKSCKPDDRSELDRRYAVTITELEKAIAYFAYYCVGPHGN